MSSDRLDPASDHPRDDAAPAADASATDASAASSRDAPSSSDAPSSADPVEEASVGSTHPVVQPQPGPASESHRGLPVGMLPDKRETVISKPAAEPPSEARNGLAQHARTPQELGASLEGSMLGHFRLEEFVGGGGMGAVFRGVDTMLGRTVAVKVLSRDRTDSETLRRFKNEAQSAARLDNENIARVYFVGEDQGLHYIVFEFIEGINVRDLVERDGPLSLADAISYTLQVAEALDHATDRNVVHRDIKPSNLLVTGEGRAKLVDMGLARLHQVETDSKDLTASGVTLGTFDYISPEQARDPRAADVRSDLYSLGCTFYFMLTGRPPFPEGTVLQKLLSHSGEDPTDPRSFRPNLDGQVVQVLNRLLAKQPSQRYQHPNELIGELLLIVERLNLVGVAQAGKVWLPPQPWFAKVERSVPWVLPGLLLVAILVILEFSWADAGGEAALSRRPNLTPPRPTSRGGDAPPVEPGSGSASPASPTGDPPSTGDEPPQPLPDDAGTAPEMPAGDVREGDPDDPLSDAVSPTEGSAGESTAGSTAATPDVLGEGSTAEVPEERPTDPADAGQGPLATDASTGDAATGVSAAGDGTEGQTQAGQPPPGQTPPGLVTPGLVNPGLVNPGDAGIAFNRVVVSPEEIEAPPGALVVSNLDMACRLAASSRLQTIELRFDGVLEERPLDVGSGTWCIRNAAGFEPTVAFRPSFEDLIGDRRMIRVTEGQLAWKGIDALLELPAESADGWALFTLDNGAGLSVEDSVLTVRNVDSRGAVLQRRVAFVSLLGSPAVAARGRQTLPSLPVPPQISFQRSLLRGQAAVLQAEQAMPFCVLCSQTLVVSSERLVDVAGARLEPSAQEGPIDIVLNHVTAVLGKGICRLSSTPEMPYQQVLVVAGKDNIVLLTGADAALIERRGAADPKAVEKRLFLRGRDNFYLNAAALLRMNPDGDPSNYRDFDFEDREQPWYQEESPRFNVIWRGLPSLGWTEDRHTPLDYLLDNDSANPAMNAGREAPAGVDSSQLPLIVDTPAAP